jgi:hypothetical protein
VPVQIEQSAPTTLELANLQPRGPVHPSPQDWGNQILYFLLPDRFSDGQEDQRPMYCIVRVDLPLAGMIVLS